MAADTHQACSYRQTAIQQEHFYKQAQATGKPALCLFFVFWLAHKWYVVMLYPWINGV